MNFSGQLDKSDLLAAARLHRWTRGSALILSVVLLALVSATLLSVVHDGEPILVASTPLLLVLLLGTLFVVMLRVSVARTYRTNSMLQLPISGRVDPEHVEFVSEHGSGKLPWSVFFRYRQSPDLVMLYQSANLYYLLPRRFFASEQDWAELRRLVALNVPERPGEGGFGRGLRMVVVFCLTVVLLLLAWALVRS